MGGGGGGGVGGGQAPTHRSLNWAPGGQVCSVVEQMLHHRPCTTPTPSHVAPVIHQRQLSRVAACRCPHAVRRLVQHSCWQPGAGRVAPTAAAAVSGPALCGALLHQPHACGSPTVVPKGPASTCQASYRSVRASSTTQLGVVPSSDCVGSAVVSRHLLLAALNCSANKYAPFCFWLILFAMM